MQVRYLILLTVLITSSLACSSRRASPLPNVGQKGYHVASNEQPVDALSGILPKDSLTQISSPPDTGIAPLKIQQKESGLEFPVVYLAADSLVLNLSSETITLHDSVELKYDKIDQIGRAHV